MNAAREIKSLLFFSKTGFFGFVIILSAFLLSIFSFFIIPDKSIHGNHQIPELALSPVGYSSLIIKKSFSKKHPLNLQSLFFGQQSHYQSIPIKEYLIENDKLSYVNLRGNTILSDISNFGADSKAAFESNCISTVWFPFGSDRYGRDIFSRLILGLRVSLFVGFFAVSLSVILGIIIGLVAGYFGGWIDHISVFFMNTVWSIPTILLVFAVVLALGRGVYVIFFAVGLTLWIDIARVVRGQTLAIKNETYIKAAESLGYSYRRTLFHHILPNAIAPVIVLAAANFAIAILIEAGLSYLGFGVKPPVPSLGNILNENYGYALSGKLFIAVIPAIFIMILVLSFNFVSYTIRDWMAYKKEA